MKSNMKNKKTPATTTKKKSLPGATSRSRRKATREMTRGTQSKDGLMLTLHLTPLLCRQLLQILFQSMSVIIPSWPSFRG